MPWHRACPEGLEIRHCDAAAKGNGLFTTRALEEGQQLFEEDPVCGMALLMFDQTNVTCHCQHCMRYVEGGEASLVLCALGCGAWYCSEACREDAFVAHHSVLCSSSNPRWADYEQQARECCNEYYVLAARALATLTSEFAVEEDLWAQSPWSGYASPCWWETMKRPIYEDSDSESSGPAFDSEDEESLDRFFQSTVRSQTSEMGDVLLSVLEGKTCALAEALLRSGPEALGRLMGLLRVNAMALHAQVASGDGDAEDVAKGMAIYSVTSAMNHDPAANCFVSSDPAYPQRCLVRTLRPIEPEEELCIDYLQGSPYSMDQRNQVLLQQYGIVA